jgi:hypothetical protein
MLNALKMDLLQFQDRKISVTPATTVGTMQAEGTHTPALLAEVLRRVVHSPDGVYIDGTFGRGGHSKAILAALGTLVVFRQTFTPDDAIGSTHVRLKRTLHLSRKFIRLPVDTVNYVATLKDQKGGCTHLM